MRLLIILSKRENFLGSAQRIKEEIDINTEILYVEDLVESDYKLYEDDILYFLCNGKTIKEYLDKVDVNCYIFNKDFLSKDYNKLEVQRILEKNNILIPTIIDYKDLGNYKFPVFCKENKHAGIIFEAYSMYTIDSFFSKFDMKDFYLEENVATTTSKEYKVYYVNNVVSYKDGIEYYNEELNELCNKLGRDLKLETYSADFIYEDGKYYLIDINPAAGFYMSKNARCELIKLIKEM